VSCASASFCAAVGQHATQRYAGPLAELWNGTRWRVTAAPGFGYSSGLRGVACLSTTFCFAVGSRQTFASQTLALRWDGAGWRRAPSANPGRYSGFAGVSCGSTTYCAAVWASGTRFGRNAGHLLVEHWNGSAWHVTPTARPGAYDELDGVSCAPGAARSGC